MESDSQKNDVIKPESFREEWKGMDIFTKIYFILNIVQLSRFLFFLLIFLGCCIMNPVGITALTLIAIIEFKRRYFPKENTLQEGEIQHGHLNKVPVNHNTIHFKSNHFTYTEQGETQSFQLTQIDKIVLFGNNLPNQSLNIYYDKGKVYTFYNDMKDWKALLDRLKSHFNFAIDTKINGKLVLYERSR